MSPVQTKVHLHIKHEEINTDLRAHIEEQLSDDDWPHRDFVIEMYNWCDIFINRLKMNIPLPAIGLKKLQKNRLGQYLQGRNQLAIAYEILFNEKHQDRPFWQHLTTLLHELGHEWQHINGEPPKRRGHNAEYISYVRSFGLIVNRKGHTLVEEGAFTELLDEFGIEYDLSSQDDTTPEQVRVKKHKWTCFCEKFTISAEEGMEPNVRCEDCGKMFKKVK